MAVNPLASDRDAVARNAGLRIPGACCHLHAPSSSVSTGDAARRSTTPGIMCRSSLGSLVRNGAPFKDWLLPKALEEVRRKLRGSGDGDRQMVTILSAVLSGGARHFV
jgi:hypothetical protein